MVNPYSKFVEENTEATVSSGNPYSKFVPKIKSNINTSNPYSVFVKDVPSITKEKQNQIVVEEVAPTMQPIKAGTYSEDDLTDDKYYGRIADYMELRFGVDEFRNLSREEVVNKFLNNMRGFSGGNTVRGVTEISFLNNLKDDEEKLKVAGGAYALYEGQAGLFSKETNVWEKLGILGDFTRETVFDPVNLIGFGIGKAFTAGGTKVASKVAQQAAIKVYKDAVKKSLAKGKTKEVAKGIGERVAKNVYAKTAISATADQVEKIAARKVIERGLEKQVLKNLSKKTVLAEIGIITGVEAVASVGTAIAYEEGLTRTGVQEDYNYSSIFLAALGSLAVGGFQGVLATSARGKGDFLGTKELVNPEEVIKRPTKKEFKFKDVVDHIKKTSPRGGLRVRYEPFSSKVARGIELQDLDTQFWIDMIRGNDSLKTKGLLEILNEQGYTWNKLRDGNVSNWVSQVIREADPQNAKAFLKEFEDATGISMVQGKALTIEQFADTFAKKVSDSGRIMKSMSMMSQQLGEAVAKETTTVGDYAEAMFSLGIKPTEDGAASNVINKYLSGGVKNFQNRIIRLLVSAPSTSFLNILGYGVATGMNTATDLAQAIVYGGVGGMQKIFGRETGNLRIAKHLLATNIQKVRNFADPMMTYDAYKSLAIADPKALRELTEVLPGGIEDMNAIIRNSGFDPNQTLLGAGSEKAIDFVQKVNFVQMQDVYSKSQELVYQLDKNLRIAFDKNFVDFYSAADSGRLMNTKEYKEVIAKATYETQRAIFSKSFKGKSTVGEVASIVEDARNIAGVGLLVPFGRFFNNTMAFMVDLTPASVVLKATGVAYKEVGKSRSYKELLTRNAVGMGLVVTMAQQEQEYSEIGLGPFERIDTNTGAVVTDKFSFPVSHLKGAARIISYWSLFGGSAEKDMPDGEFKEIMDTLGPRQITRALNQQVNGMGDAFQLALQGDKEAKIKFVKVFGGGILSQVVSGGTRFLDPVNATVGLFQGEDFKKLDRKQGSDIINKSLRYMDNIVSSFTTEETRKKIGLSTKENYTAVTGTERGDESRNLGVREKELNDTIAVLNMVGKPLWKQDKMTQIGEAGNRYNELFNRMVENESMNLRRDPDFIKGDPLKIVSLLDYRTNKVGKMLRKVREVVKSMMQSEFGEGDIRLTTLMDIVDGNSFKQIDKAIENLFPDEDISVESLSKLEMGQLSVLKQFLDMRETREGSYLN